MEPFVSEYVVDTILEHVVYQDRDMKIQWVNAAACDSLGLTRDEVIGRRCHELWGCSPVPCANCPVRRAMETGRPQEGEQTTPDGRVWSVRGYPVRDDQGNVIGGCELTLEITERRRAQEAYHALVDHSLQGLVILQDMTVVFANRAMAEISGYTVEEILAAPQEMLREFVHPVDRKMVWAHHQARLRGDRLPEGYVFRVVRKDGQTRWLEIHTSRVEYQGRPAIQAACVDITQRRHTEQALKESEEKFKNLAEQSPNMIFINRKGRIVYANERCEKVMGYTKEEFHSPDFHFLKLVAPEFRDTAEHNLRRHMNGTDVPSVEYQLVTKAGRRIDAILTTKLIDYEGDRAILGIVTDVTEQMQAERRLRESESRLRATIESLPFDFFLIGEDGRYAMANAVCRQRWGDPVGKRLADVCPDPRMLAISQENNRRAFAGEVVEGDVMLAPHGEQGYYHNIVSPIRDGDEIRGILGLNIDITERRLAEDALRYRAELETTVAEISHDFVSVSADVIEKRIGQALERLGRFCGADRSYVMMLHDDGTRMSQSYEWCAEGVESDQDRTRGVEIKRFPWAMERLTEGGVLDIARVADLPEAARGLKEALHASGVAALVVAPVTIGGVVLGFLGVSAVRRERTWSADEITLTKLVAESFANALERKRAADETSKRLAFETLLSDLSAAFVQIPIERIDPEITQWLERVARFLGIDRATVVRFPDDAGDIDVSHAWTAPGLRHPPSALPRRDFEWFLGDLQRGGVRAYPRIDEAPEQAASEKAYCRREGLKSVVVVPVAAGESTLGAVVFSAVRQERSWSDELVQRLRLVGEIFASTLLRKRAVQQLEREHHFVSRITETSPTGIFRVDRDGRIVFANAYAERILGLTRDVIARRCYNAPEWRITDYEGRPFPDEQLPFSQVKRTRKPVYDVRHAIEWPDGRRVLLRMNAAPLFEESGQFDGAVVATEDVTESIRAEEALRRSEVMLKSIIESSPSAVIVITPEATIVDGNPRSLDMYGAVSKDELIGRNGFDLIVPRDVEQARDVLAQALATGVARHAELTIRRSDGTEFLGDFSLGVIPNASGEPSSLVVIVDDITERKRMETALRESEGRFRGVFDNAVLGLYRTTPDGRILMANPSLVRMLGYASFEELAEINVKQGGHADGSSRSQFESLIESEGEVAGIESAWRRRDGTTLFVRETARAIRDEQGQTLYYEGTVEDVSERTKAERALEESQAKLQSVFDSSPYAITVTDLAGTIVECNQAALDIHGADSKDELIGLSGHLLTADASLPESQKGMAQAIEEGIVRGREYTLLRRDATAFPAEVSASVIRDRSGRAAGLVVIAVDITERKEAEEALRRSEKKYRELYEGSRDAVAAVDMNGRFIESNAVFRAMLGYSQEDLVGLTYEDVTPAKWHAEEARICQEQVLTRGYSDIYEKEYIRKDGAVFPIELRSYLRRNESGHPTGMWAFIRDITDRQHAEAQAQEHLAELTRAWHANTLGEMASGLAHELNQPLCAILNYSSGCLRMTRRTDFSVDVVRDSIEKIVGQAERAADIIKRIRSLVGKHEPCRATVDLNAVIGDAIDMIRGDAERQHVALVAELARDLPAIRGDAVEIEQVVLNLARNAIEAMSDPKVAERRFTVSTSLTADQMIEVAVADSGCGFSADLAEKIFDSFFTTRNQGLGVGLSLSRRIVEAHGGRLWAESDGVSGATFRFTLPASGVDHGHRAPRSLRRG